MTSRSSAASASYTWDDFIALEEDDLRELIDGELVEVEVPTKDHERVIFKLGGFLDRWEEEHGGTGLTSGYKVRISARSGVMPDLQFSRAGNEISADQKQGSLDIKLQVYLLTEKMRVNKLAPFLLSESNPRDLYWTPAQLIAHHTSNGCNLQTGDLLATGTISGPSEASGGCLLELTRNGAKPILLPTGELRTFLADGDEITLSGFCEVAGHPRIGLGESRATILPARN